MRADWGRLEAGCGRRGSRAPLLRALPLGAWLPLSRELSASCPAPGVGLRWPCLLRCCLLVTGSQAPSYSPTVVADEEEVTTKPGG